MKTARHAYPAATALVVSFVALEAHPGHNHGDFVSVLRQPVADWQHMLITAMAALTAGIICHLATQAGRTPALVRWTGSISAALGAAWLLN